MPDERQHRGPQELDRELFADHQLPILRRATSELGWLLSRGYALNSSLKLVGDRYQLVARQRIAVSRCVATQDECARRKRYAVDPAALSEAQLWIDGFNLLTSLEAALGGGVILQGVDGTFRDMASMHGTYRHVQESIPAVEIAGRWLENHQVASCHWLLDEPVSNSGRLKQLILALAQRHGWSWQVELVPDPDAVLVHVPHMVVTADSAILNRAHRWANLARWIIESTIEEAWLVSLADVA